MRRIKEILLSKIGAAILLLSAVLVLCLFTCCTPVYNVPLQTNSPEPVSFIDQDSTTLIIFTASGGGTRAAATSYRVLKELEKITYLYTRGTFHTKTNLMKEIDIASGISGGSFPVAALGLGNGMLDSLRKNFIEKDIQGALLKSMWVPPRIIRMMSPYYDRINLASEYYDKHIFYRKTFADIKPFPRTWINGSLLAIGYRLTYTQEFFDYIDSDLSKYPVAYACAASSAFPGLLNPITLKNYGVTLPDSVLKEDIRYEMALLNSRRSLPQYHYARMRRFLNDKKNAWLHIADGGLVDNQGLQGVVDAWTTNNGVINREINNPPYLKRIIIINVNAGVAPIDKSCEKQNAPYLLDVLGYTMTTSMDILSAKRWEEIKGLAKELYKAKIDLPTNPIWANLEKPYLIEVSFRNIVDPVLREQCNKLPTNFHLKKEQLQLIDDVVPTLLKEDPDMQRLLKILEKD